MTIEEATLEIPGIKAWAEEQCGVLVMAAGAPSTELPNEVSSFVKIITSSPVYQDEVNKAIFRELSNLLGEDLAVPQEHDFTPKLIKDAGENLYTIEKAERCPDISQDAPYDINIRKEAIIFEAKEVTNYFKGTSAKALKEKYPVITEEKAQQILDQLSTDVSEQIKSQAKEQAKKYYDSTNKKMEMHYSALISKRQYKKCGDLYSGES